MLGLPKSRFWLVIILLITVISLYFQAKPSPLEDGTLCTSSEFMCKQVGIENQKIDLLFFNGLGNITITNITASNKFCNSVNWSADYYMSSFPNEVNQSFPLCFGCDAVVTIYCSNTLELDNVKKATEIITVKYAEGKQSHSAKFKIKMCPDLNYTSEAGYYCISQMALSSLEQALSG